MVAEPKALLERDVQSRCVAYARDRDWWARKFSSPANRSVPDYIFGKQGCTVFVEFKAPGKKPTDAQSDEHKAMAAVGLTVHVIDNVAVFKRLWLELEDQLAAGVYAKR
jgi:hypothetical protein